MIRIVDDPTPYLKAIEKLPGTLREFMLDFVDPKKTTWRDTKQEIRYRLQSVLENPILSRFFTSEETKLDLFTLMNEGAVILIDTAEEFLKDGSAIFGRLWISLILQAVMERAVLDAKKRTPTFLYIDEAYSYFDQNIDSLLTDARKFSCGCILAHHHLDQASEGLRSSLASNTGIKFVSGVSAKDARAMASEMRTTPEFIETQPRYQFATYVRGVTPHAVPVEVSPSPLSKPAAKMSPAEYQERIAANRRRVSFGLEGPRRMPPPSSPQSPDEDISKKW
jgi:hypothetical protein